jgi:hypothetical protein
LRAWSVSYVLLRLKPIIVATSVKLYSIYSICRVSLRMCARPFQPENPSTGVRGRPAALVYYSLLVRDSLDVAKHRPSITQQAIAQACPGACGALPWLAVAG